MELLVEARAEAVESFGDSKPVISQLTEEYRCESESLLPLWEQSLELMAHKFLLDTKDAKFRGQ
jgi:hypothetical protein